MASIAEQIAAEAKRQGVNPALAIEVSIAESGMNPNIRDSPKGAIGLFQLLPATAASLGVNPRDAMQNIRGGVAYLRQLLGQFGEIPAALAAYNWGPGRMSATLAKYGAEWALHIPTETAVYVQKILAALGQQYQARMTPESMVKGAIQTFMPEVATTPVPEVTGEQWKRVLLLTGLAVGAYLLTRELTE